MQENIDNSRPITSQLGQKNPNYLEGLNDEQRQAVLNIKGPLLVLAGAGTGKTRVLTTRIAHILASNLARGDEILSVTFTNKAALEMKERIGKLAGINIEAMPWLGTFHSIGAKILRRHAELVGLKPDFTILDTDDQIRLIKQLLSAENIDEKRWPARQFAATLDGWKNKGLLPKDITSSKAGMFANGIGDKLYADYQARLTSLNAADFGDLLLLCIRLFRENPDILALYHSRFKYMLVDEYQDSNIAQYLWLRLLAQGKPSSEANICVVGDDDQSIYGWRGAEVDNILRFEKDFEGAKIIKLERNYRSTGNILDSASSVIAHNEGRIGKTLHTDNGEKGEKLALTSLWDSEEEARHVAEQIEQLQHKKEQLNSMAILVRTSAQMREFEEIFVKLGINYRVIGGAKFYERREIRDALAYLRLTHQNSYDLALERIINVPKRGLGNASVKIIHATARAQNISMMQAIRLLIETEELGKKQRSTLSFLISQFDDWAKRAKTLPPFELAEAIFDESGYTAMWQNEKTADAPGRLENLKELVNFMQEFETLGEFLEHISLVLDRAGNDSNDAISIMTLHAAKGLEFNNIFLPGWEEGLFPSQRSLDENGLKGLEEERRLAYVGLTRAKKRIFLSLAQNRRIHGLWKTAIPSRFLDELPPNAVIISDTGSSSGGYNYGGVKSNQAERDDKSDALDDIYEAPGWKRMRANKSAFSAPKTIDGEFSEQPNDYGSGYRNGQRVTHLKFGEGTITNIEGKKLSIDFDRVGRKKVLDSFVKAAI
jgi:DNA helicase-2/ATP-dependent DNA helicase PcrA